MIEKSEVQASFGRRPSRRGPRNLKYGTVTAAQPSRTYRDWRNVILGVLAFVIPTSFALAIELFHLPFNRYNSNNLTLGLKSEWQHWRKGGNFHIYANCRVDKRPFTWGVAADSETEARAALFEVQPHCDILDITGSEPNFAYRRRFFTINYACTKGPRWTRFVLSGRDVEHAKSILKERHPECAAVRGGRFCYYHRLNDGDTITVREPDCTETSVNFDPSP